MIRPPAAIALTCDGIGRAQLAAIVLTLVAGLAIDVRCELPGQVALSAAVWLLLLHLLSAVRPAERHILLACLALATAGELFLSLVWGLYTYRLENVPLFVPPGHVMLLVLGVCLAQRLSERAAFAILAAAAAYALAVTIAGIDTLAVPLFALIAAISIAMPQHRRLYASTFVLALLLELYGTALGNWTWSRQVPLLPLVTTNPPVIASAFYAVLDALVACTALVLARRVPGLLAFRT